MKFFKKIFFLTSFTQKGFERNIQERKSVHKTLKIEKSKSLKTWPSEAESQVQDLHKKEEAEIEVRSLYLVMVSYFHWRSKYWEGWNLFGITGTSTSRNRKKKCINFISISLLLSIDHRDPRMLSEWSTIGTISPNRKW